MRKLSAPAVLGIGVLSVACSSDPATGGGGQAGATGKGGSTYSGGSAGASSGAGGDSPSAGSGGSISAGSGGSAGAMGGSAGASGSGGTGGSGGASTMPSLGCGKAAPQAPDEWVEQAPLTIDSVERPWWVWLPNNYDQTRAYPIVFLFHGCGGGDNNVPMQTVTGEDAIVVRSVSAEADLCWETAADGPDVALFDAMLEATLQGYCADSSRVFAAGYSSGSWLINTLDCVRGDKIRAAGSVAGGTPGGLGDCVGQVARIFVHDVNDNDNDISGSVTERDRLLELNHCDADTPPVPEDPAPCARYQGCDPGYPVIWCQTSGQGHSRQDDLAAPAFWGLFSEL
jgi:polyhydroxybutyrate depolymerase